MATMTPGVRTCTRRAAGTALALCLACLGCSDRQRVARDQPDAGSVQAGSGTGEDGGRIVPGADAGARKPLEVIASAERDPYGLAIDDRYVYWTSGAQVRRAPLAGGAAVTLASGKSPNRIAVADGVVFFSDGAAGTVSRVEREGGAAQVIGSGTFPNGLAVRDGELYWANTGMTIGDGSIGVVKVDGAQARVLLDGLPQPGALALDGRFVYFTSTGQSCGASSGGGGGCVGGGVSKAPRAGGAPVSIDAQGIPSELALGARGAYWMITPGPMVMFAPADGSAARMLARVLGEDAGPIAVDADGVYFSSTGKGRVLKLGLDGGEPLALVTDLGQVGGIAVDRDWVYVAATSQGRILRVAKDGSAAKPSGPISGPCPKPVGSAEEIAATPRADGNLELLALRLDEGKLVATQETYERVLADVAAIRAAAPALAGIGYFAPHDGKQLLVSPDAVTFQSIDAGEYTAWDCLNDFYGLEKLELQRFEIIDSYVLITLEGRYDLAQVGAVYAMLPGIRSVEINGIGGDGSTIYARRQGAGIEYIVDRAGGDCPAGCTTHDAHRFVSSAPGVIEADGTWNSESGSPPPAWWTMRPRRQ